MEVMCSWDNSRVYILKRIHTLFLLLIIFIVAITTVVILETFEWAKVKSTKTTE